MSLLYTPKSSRFEQVALNRAIEMAESIIKVEQELRIGETGTRQPDGQFSEISPMKYFIFDKMGEVFPLWGDLFGEPQEHPMLDGKAQIALLVKIFVNVLESRVVLHTTEAWTADKCHNCGEKYSTKVIKGGPCECGEERIPPRENPHASEILMCNIAHFVEHSEGEDERPTFGGYSWIYEILRDGDHKVTGFKAIREKEEGGLGGRMSEHWVINECEGPIMMLNYPRFCDALGVECSPEIRAEVERTRSAMPKDYPMLTWGVHTDIDEVVKIADEQHRRVMAKFN